MQIPTRSREKEGATSVNNWDELEKEEISLTEMNELVARMTREWEEVERIDAEKKKAREIYDRTEALVLEMLKKSGGTKYHVEGLGTVSITRRFSLKVPKEIPQKLALFSWIKENKGVEALNGMVSINSQTLNAFFKVEKENNPELILPGVELPTLEESLAFRAERKK
jgi:uncharacterized small protein (DUF1192 family)